MTKQQALNTLSELEEYFFYAPISAYNLDEIDEATTKALDAIHADIKDALTRFHELTGLTLTE